MAEKIHTRDSMRVLIQDGENVLLERGVLSLFALQTVDEKHTKKIRHDNKRGFSKRTVKDGTYIATYLLGYKGRRLSGRFVEMCRTVCLHHAAQLAAVANGGYLRGIRDAKFDDWGIKY